MAQQSAAQGPGRRPISGRTLRSYTTTNTKRVGVRGEQIRGGAARAARRRCAGARRRGEGRRRGPRAARGAAHGLDAQRAEPGAAGAGPGRRRGRGRRRSAGAGERFAREGGRAPGGASRGGAPGERHEAIG